MKPRALFAYLPASYNLGNGNCGDVGYIGTDWYKKALSHSEIFHACHRSTKYLLSRFSRVEIQGIGSATIGCFNYFQTLMFRT